MRDIKELLLLLRDEVEQNLKFGMCGVVSGMYHNDIISRDEKNYMFEFVNENKPEYAGSIFWFPKGEKPPRLDWIDEQLLELYL
jgi:hypothetical protein